MSSPHFPALSRKLLDNYFLRMVQPVILFCLRLDVLTNTLRR